MSKKIGLESQYSKLYPVKANIGKLIVAGVAKVIKGSSSKKPVEMLTVKPTVKGKPVGGKSAAAGAVGTGLGYYDTVINETDVESKMGGGIMNYNEGGFPDLNEDGKTTYADVLMGRLKGKNKNGKK
jgi:hypothetical protein